MDPIYKFSASPGTPLFPVSPERANRQALPQSPSLPSDLHDPFKMSHSKESSAVQNKVAQFNSLSKEAVQRRKDNEAAMRRAVLGREEAENETRRLKDEYRELRKELEEGKVRERKVAERIESVMEELHRTKETQAHAQSIYEKEVRRARKEAFKSSSALVNLQEELKTTRNRYTLMREEVDVQKRKNENKEQDIFTSHHQLISLQEELDKMRRQIKMVEKERDALKTSLKQEEVARIAAEGKVALPPSRESDELASQKKRRESIKENVDPEALEIEVEEQETELEVLKERLRMEKQLRTNADSLIDFMKMECQFHCCPCRVAEQEGRRYVHDGSVEQEMEKLWSTVSKGFVNEQPSIPPLEPSESVPSSPLRRPSLHGQTTEMLLNFSPSIETFFKVSTSTKQVLHDLPPLPADDLEEEEEEDIASIMYDPETPSAPPAKLPPHPTPTASSYFPPQEQALPVQIPQPLRPPPNLQSSTARQPSTIRSVTYPIHTITTSIPLAPIPVSPDRTITRDEALEQIRQRRGRARSIAAANGTPRRGLVMGTPDARRNASAPARD
ncbi:MAG: hypothetical protein Q9182_001428 [Xanthomendoza sp. 2 TL-2023]